MFKQIRKTIRSLLNRLKPQAKPEGPTVFPIIEKRPSSPAKEAPCQIIQVALQPQRQEPCTSGEKTYLPALRSSLLIQRQLGPLPRKTEPAAEGAEHPSGPQGVDEKPTALLFREAARHVDSLGVKAESSARFIAGAKNKRPAASAAPVKHPSANYYDETGKLAEASYRDLEDESFLRYVYSHNISFFDDAGHGLQIRLFESGSRRPHFWLVPQAKAAPRTRTFDNAPADRETDRVHETRIDYLLKTISKAAPSHVYTIDWEKGGSAKGKKRDILDAERFVLGDIGGYYWKKNSEQFSLSLGNVRPDIIGNLKRPRSEQHPSIIIEVINTHFPSEPTWEAYLQHTIERPLLVLFDFTEKWNYFLQVHSGDEKKQDSHTTMRAVYYLWKGFLWQNTTPLEERPSSQNFKKLVDLNIRKLNRRTINSPKHGPVIQPPGPISG